MTVICHQNLCPQIVSGWWEGRICKLFCHFFDRIVVYLVFLFSVRSLFKIVQNTTDLSDHLNEKLPPLQEGVDDEVKVDQLLSLLSQKKDNADDDEVKVDHISIFVNRRNLLCRNRWDTANKPSAAKTIRRFRLQKRKAVQETDRSSFAKTIRI